MTRGKRQFHLATEVAALALVAPFMFYLGATTKRRHVRWIAYTIGTATVIIDGGLVLHALTDSS